MKVVCMMLFFGILCSVCVFAIGGDGPSISVSLLNQDPDPVSAGEVVELRLGIENLGGSPVNNLIVEVVPKYPLEIVQGENNVQRIATLNSFQYDRNIQILRYRVGINKQATSGEYSLDVVYYREGDTAKIRKTVPVIVRSNENAEVIYIDKSVLIPGRQDSLKFTITNVGNAPLKDMTFYWLNPDNILLPVGGDNTRHIKHVDIGESSIVEYQVIADTNANPGLYRLDLYLTYADPMGVDRQKTSVAGVYIGGMTDFNIAYSESSGGDTSFSVANIGSNPAYSVSVIVPAQQGYRTTGSNSVIIGNLNKGDYTVATFRLQSGAVRNDSIPARAGEGSSAEGSSAEGSSAEGSSNVRAGGAFRDRIADNALRVQVAYTDTMGLRHVVDKEVVLPQQSTTTVVAEQMMNFRGRQQQKPWDQYKWYIIVLIVLVAGFFALRRHRSRKSGKRSMKQVV